MAATAVYEYPVAGTAGVIPAPTVAQVKDLVTFAVIGSAAAETIAVTHNMNLSLAELTLGFPIVILEPLFASAGTEVLSASWIVAAKATATVSLTHLAAGSSDIPMLRVHVLRPHTIGR